MCMRDDILPTASHTCLPALPMRRASPTTFSLCTCRQLSFVLVYSTVPPSRPIHVQGFPHDLFPVYMEDDDALLRASHAAWVLEPVTGEGLGAVGGLQRWAALRV